MSCTTPAATLSRRPPPPHDWNRSGMSPAWMLVWIAALKASFHITVMLIFTFGCNAVYASAMACQSALPGSLFWMCHQSISTLSPLVAATVAGVAALVAAGAAASVAAGAAAFVAAGVDVPPCLPPAGAVNALTIQATDCRPHW